MSSAKAKREARNKRFDYSKSDPDRRQREHKSGFDRTAITLPDGMEFFKIDKAGTYRVDIIPFIAGKGNPFADKGTPYYERTYFNHRNIGANEDSYICSNKTFSKPCYVCDWRGKAGKDADEQTIKDLAPKERQLWNVWDHADKDKNAKLWDISFHLFGKLLDARIKGADEDEEYRYFWHDDKSGLTLKLTVAEKTMGRNTFYEVIAIDFKPRKADLPDEVVESAVCLDELIIETPYAKLKKVFLQVPADKDEDDEDDDDDDDKPKGKGKGKGKKPAPPDDDEDDDEDEDEDDDDEDDDEDEDDDDSPPLGPPPDEKLILKMDREDLEELIEDYKLDIDPEKFKRTKSLAKRVAEACALWEAPDDDEDDDEDDDDLDNDSDEDEDDDEDEDSESDDDEDWDDDEDFDDEDDEDEDDEDEEPVKSSKKSAKGKGSAATGKGSSTKKKTTKKGKK